MRTVSTIQSTRLGFLYQDMYAILCYLEHLLGKNVQKFYVDYPLDGNKSLDIRIITTNNVENVYEVKSGEQFKESKNEIVDAINNLYFYSRQRPKAQLYLIIRKEFRCKISEYLHALNRVQGYTLRKKDVSDGLRFLPELEQKLSDKQRHAFYNTLKLDNSLDDQNCNPNIEEVVLAKIKKLTYKFDLKWGDDKWPDELLMHNLIYESLRNAGSSKDLNNVFQKVIVNFLVSRKFHLLHYQYRQASKSPLIEEDTIRKEIEAAYSEKFDQTIVGKKGTLDGSFEGSEPK